MSWLDLDQRVTYWSPSSYDTNGDPVIPNGVAVDAKWSETDGIIKTADGKDLKITLFVYSETEIPKDALVVLEDLDGQATPPDGARPVLSVKSNPSMDTLFKMIL